MCRLRFVYGFHSVWKDETNKMFDGKFHNKITNCNKKRKNEWKFVQVHSEHYAMWKGLNSYSLLCAVCEVNGMHVLHIVFYLIECGRERITEDLFTCLCKEWFFLAIYTWMETWYFEICFRRCFWKRWKLIENREFSFKFCFIH